MSVTQVQHFLGRARDFLKGMDLLKEDLAEYRFSSALLGIHGAISYCDALRTGLGSGKLSSEDHQSAAGELRSLLAARRSERQQGADRLEKLLSKKSRIAYARDATGDAEIKLIVQQAERFAAWAESTGKELRIEGW
ncbi:MAG: hypothetical protein ACRD27_09590 [Terracidiphilus sp.]